MPIAASYGGVDRTSPSRSGRRMRAVSASAVTSTTGTAAAIRCARSGLPGCGRSSFRTCGSAPATSSRCSAPTPSGGRRLTRWPRHRAPAGDRERRVRVGVRLVRRRLARSAGAYGLHAAPISIYEVHLGSWRQGLSYRELADQLVDYVTRHAIHPRRIPAGGRASLRWLLGLPGHVLLRADQPIRQSGRIPLPDRPAAPGRYRRDRRLGACALPQGRVGTRPVRRHPAVRAR